jgi:hypothetical protein
VSGFAGFGEAGDGEAGVDDTATLTARAVTPPHALFLDPAVMDFTADADGHYQSVHPVDHKVELALAVAFGSVASVETIGSGLRNLRIGTREQMTTEATQIARTALAPLLAAGDVVLASVVAYAANAWRAHVEITYQNTRAPDADRYRTSTLG